MNENNRTYDGELILHDIESSNNETSIPYMSSLSTKNLKRKYPPSDDEAVVNVRPLLSTTNLKRKYPASSVGVHADATDVTVPVLSSNIAISAESRAASSMALFQINKHNNPSKKRKKECQIQKPLNPNNFHSKNSPKRSNKKSNNTKGQKSASSRFLLEVPADDVSIHIDADLGLNIKSNQHETKATNKTARSLKNHKYFCPTCLKQGFKWSKLGEHLKSEHGTELRDSPGGSHPLHMTNFDSSRYKKNRQKLLNERNLNNTSLPVKEVYVNRSSKQPQVVVSENKKNSRTKNWSSNTNESKSPPLSPVWGDDNEEDYNNHVNGEVNAEKSPKLPPIWTEDDDKFSTEESTREKTANELQCLKSGTATYYTDIPDFEEKKLPSISMSINKPISADTMKAITILSDQTSNSQGNCSTNEKACSKRYNLAEQIRERANETKHKPKGIKSILRKARKYSAQNTNVNNTQNKEESHEKIEPNKNFLQSISKMVTKVHFAPDDELTKTRVYEVTTSDLFYYCSSNQQSNEEEQVAHEARIQGFDDQTSSHDDEEFTQISYIPVTKLTQLALHGSINDMIKCLKGGSSARGINEEKPIEKIKEEITKLQEKFSSLNKSAASLTSSSMAASQAKERIIFIKQRIKQFEVKKTVLKIFKEAEIIIELARSMHPGLNTINRSDDQFKTKRNVCAKKIRDVCLWIERFQKDTPRLNLDIDTSLVDVNLAFHGNMTMLHASVCIFAVDAIQNLLRMKAKDNIRCSDMGTVADLAKSLCEEAKSRGDAKYQNAFVHILWDLQK